MSRYESIRDVAEPDNVGWGALWGSHRLFATVLILCCGASLVPLWIVTYPPAIDLAQHAAQVATWRHWDDKAFDYSQYFWINWRTPYLLSNTLAYLLSWVVPIRVAFKLLISITIVGIPLATLALIRETRGNPWWAFAAVPVGYSFAFYLGFVAFTFATPLGLFFLLLAWRYAHRPTRSRAWLIFASLVLLFLTHVIVFGWAGLIGALFTVARAPTVRAMLRRWSPYLAGLVLPVAWIFLTLSTEVTTHNPAIFAYDLFRWTEVLALVVGWTPTAGALLTGGLLLLTPWVAGAKPSREVARWIPLLVTLCLFFGTPSSLFGTDLLYQRFAVFLVPTLLFALDCRIDPAHLRWRGLAAGVALTWLFYLGIQFTGYSAEVGALEQLVDAAEPNRRLLYLPLDAASEYIPYPVFKHTGAWYQVERGGLVDYSFAQHFPNRFRYFPEVAPSWPKGGARFFNWHRDGGELYDYILIHSHNDPTMLFHRTRAPMLPAARATGGWWLWTKATSMSPPAGSDAE